MSELVIDRSVADSPPASSPRTRQLDREACRGFLQRMGWGVLSLLDGDRPYAVPVSYGTDEGYLYLASGPGRKLRAIERDARVCLTVVEVLDADHWTSVLVEGRLERMLEVSARVTAMRSIHRHRRVARFGRAVNLMDVDRLLGARFLRLSLDDVSGRRSG